MKSKERRAEVSFSLSPNSPTISRREREKAGGGGEPSTGLSTKKKGEIHKGERAKISTSFLFTEDFFA